jgi:hypothetical protein
MSGQWRPQTRTVLNLPIVAVDTEKNCILIRGSVAGPKLAIVKIRSTVETGKAPFVVSPVVDYTTQTIEQIQAAGKKAADDKLAAQGTKALNPMKNSKKMGR